MLEVVAALFHEPTTGLLPMPPHMNLSNFVIMLLSFCSRQKFPYKVVSEEKRSSIEEPGSKFCTINRPAAAHDFPTPRWNPCHRSNLWNRALPFTAPSCKRSRVRGDSLTQGVAISRWNAWAIPASAADLGCKDIYALYGMVKMLQTCQK